MTRSLINSALVHGILVLLLLFSLADDKKEQRDKGDSDQGNKSEQSNVTQIELLEVGNGDAKCASKYVGIGVVYDSNSGTILRAPDSNPAYKAGIREGDILLTRITDKPTKGEWIFVVVNRDGESLSFHVQVDEICTTKPKN
jgi:C-terminal processing protease CtpA/Prc